jgi:hypothetical protein
MTSTGKVIMSMKSNYFDTLCQSLTYYGIDILPSPDFCG